MSRYDNDERAVLHDDGTAIIPDPGGYDGPPSGDWLVKHSSTGEGLELHNDGGEQGYVYDEGAWYASRSRVPKVFDTADAAIAYVIGAPRDADTTHARSAAEDGDDTTDGM
jgi:hypothetical protein